MSSVTTTDLSMSLQQLATCIIRLVVEAKTNGEIKPTEESYYQVKFKGFQYTSDGPKYESAQGSDTHRPTWYYAPPSVSAAVQHLPQYGITINLLTATMGDGAKATSYLEQFTNGVIRHGVQTDPITNSVLENIVPRFLKDVRGEAQEAIADAKLEGVVVGLPEAAFEAERARVLLRQICLADIEKERPLVPFHPSSPFLDVPTAILRIQRQVHDTGELQREVARAVCILRLFRVSSARCSSFQWTSDSIIGFRSGTFYEAPRFSALEKASLSEKDLAQMPTFWRTLAPRIPRSFFDPIEKETGPTTISFQRYSDALLLNSGFGSRVASAVMALEALFLGDGETQEMTYRLGMRLGALMNALSLDPVRSYKVVKTAYPIRSHFVHGSTQSASVIKKLKSQFGGGDVFMRALLEEVRTSIISFLCLQMDKKKFLILLDEAMLSNSHRSRLFECVQNAKTLLKPFEA